MGLKILVAEDSPSIALLYKKSLEKRGHTVIITENGLKCLYQYSDDFKIRGDDKKKTSLYDLVILDHKMPRMEGTEVAKEIIEMNPKQRILFVTGYVKDMMKGVRKIGQRIELLQKPFPVNAMIRQVEGVNTRWRKKIIENKSQNPWDEEMGLSEVHR
ncbi:MAG TPA: response regulator [Nitrosopumilaceae archaeon]|nr:response regulator [Nitrosopumilaceae archaeon]